MIRIWKYLILLLMISVIGIPLTSSANYNSNYNEKEQLEVVYFYNNACGSCNPEDDFIMFFNQAVGDEKDNVYINLRMYNIFDIDAYKLINKYYKLYDVPKEQQVTPIIFVGDTYIVGEENIKENFRYEFIKQKDRVFNKNKSIKNVKNTQIVYFYICSCDECNQVNYFIENLASKNNVKVEKLNVAEIQNLELIQKYFKQYSVPISQQKVPIIFIGNKFIQGAKAIKTNLVNEIKNNAN